MVLIVLLPTDRKSPFAAGSGGQRQSPQQSFDPSPETIMCIIHFMQIMQSMQAFRLNGPVDPQATRQ